MKRQERGITGRPRRRLRFWSAKAYIPKVSILDQEEWWHMDFTLE